MLASPAYGALVAAMRRAEHDGLDMRAAFRAIAAADSLIDDADQTGTAWGAGAVRDPAALLQWRVEQWCAHATRSRHDEAAIASGDSPAGPSADDLEAHQRDAIIDVETRIAARTATVTANVIDHRPTWLRALGSQPLDPQTRDRWETAVAGIAAYRDSYNITETTHPLGTATPTDSTQRAAREQALRRMPASSPVHPATHPSDRDPPHLQESLPMSSIFDADPPTQPDLASTGEQSRSAPVCWKGLDHVSAVRQQRTLDEWVRWVTARYMLTPRTVPPCWSHHGGLLEELSALHTGWLAAFAPYASGDAPLDWHTMFCAARQRLQETVNRAGCSKDDHRDDRCATWLQQPDPAPDPASDH